MNTQISIDGSSVIVTFQEADSFSFDVNDSINLNEFIESLSNFNELMSLTPEAFDSFEDADQGSDPESLKLVEYLYEIFEAFNDSYEEVFLGDVDPGEEENDAF